jgi:hypothetical protein
MQTSIYLFYKRNLRWLIPVALFVLAALVYLPLVRQLGFLKDDWYLMYDARVHGPGFFSTIFASDRPARAPLQFVLYSLFGEHLLYYHLSAYLFRATGAVALWMTLTMLWPTQKRSNLLSSALFLIYPGFLSQPNAVDFQAHLFSLMLAMISIALSVKSVLSERKQVKWSLAVLAILSGWCYLALMEYFIGLEVLRFTLIALIAHRRQAATLLKFLREFLARYWIFALSPVGFLIWRLFIFQSERRATDIGSQVGQLFSSPLNTGLWWLIYMLQDSVNVIITAWVVPLYTLAFGLRLRELLLALLTGILTAVLLYLLWKTQEDNQNSWQPETLIIGLLAVFGGLFPVILANRHVDFGDYSRYTLPAMAGGVMILAGMLAQLKSQTLRSALIIFLAINAGMTQYANAATAVAETQATRDFWWQVAWRVPGLKSGTSLVADYPSAAIQEDYFVWGPASQIYFPQKQSGEQVNVPLGAIVLTPQNAILISVGRGQDTQYRRGNFTQVDYHNVLILTQPASNACVRVLDGKQPELSENDRAEIMLTASDSRADNILPDRAEQIPPASIFGGEPAHGWCYYYQKASLARQQGDWKSVAALGEKALAEGFYPSDKIEWLPFLQAYTVLGQPEKLRRFVSIMGESPFIQKQVCAILVTSTFDPKLRTSIQEAFCK